MFNTILRIIEPAGYFKVLGFKYSISSCALEASEAIIFKKIPCELIPLNFELDGNFPAHPSNPLLPESQVGIKAKIKETKADFGVILDGDTDRLFTNPTEKQTEDYITGRYG